MYSSSLDFLSLKPKPIEKPFFTFVGEKCCLNLKNEPIDTDHYIILISYKSKHMAFKDSDWLETN